MATTKINVNDSQVAITSGKLLTVSNTLTLAGTDSSSVDFGTGGTVAYGTSVSVVATVTGIDGKTVAVTDLYTVPTAKTFFFIGCMIRMTTGTAVTVSGIAGVRRSSDSGTLVNGVTMSGLDTTGECFWMIPSLGTTNANALFAVVAADKVQFNLFSAFTATTATLDFHLVGYLL